MQCLQVTVPSVKVERVTAAVTPSISWIGGGCSIDGGIISEYWVLGRISADGGATFARTKFRSAYKGVVMFCILTE